jgi:tetratricopeptide (TPR) repeat protein
LRRKVLVPRRRAIRREIGNQHGVADTLNEMAIMLRHEGRLSRAWQMFEEARRIQHQLGDRRAESHSIGNIGNVLNDEGDIVNSKKAFEESIAISQEIGDKSAQAISLGNLADELMALGKVDEARKKFEESRRISIEVGNKYMTSYADLAYAGLLLQTGDLPVARQKSDEALSLAVQLGEQIFIAAAHAESGDLLLVRGDLSDAEKEYKNSIAIATKVGSNASVADVQLSLAQLRIEQGDSEGAFNLATQVLQEYKTEKSTRRQAGAELVVARAFLAQGKVAAARTEIQHAKKLLRKNQDRRLDITFQITEAMVAAKNRITAHDAAEAVARSVFEAKKLGFVLYQFEARLALGEIEMQSRTIDANAHLNQLQQDATAQGFLLIARKAGALRN